MSGSAKLQTLLRLRFTLAKRKLLKLLTSARKVTICLDGWTKKGLTASFLGISASFFDPQQRVPRHALLSLLELTESHTGEMLSSSLEKCLHEWNIPASKVLLVVSDNGANMVKAIRLLQERTNIQAELSATATQPEPEEGAEGDDEDCDTQADDQKVGEEADDDAVGDATESEDACVDEEEHDDGNEDDADSDDSHEDEDDIPLARLLFTDLPAHIVYPRLPCMAHCLQLVVKIIYKHPAYEPVIQKARHIVVSIRKSPTLIGKLVSLCGKSVVMDCTTRWNSTNSMLKRLIQIKVSINQVMTEASVDTLVASEWAKLDEIVLLLDPFAKHTDNLQSDTSVLSNIVPTLLDLACHLQQFDKEKGLMQVCSTQRNVELCG